MRGIWRILLLVTGLSACAQQPVDPRSILTRAQLDQVTEPLLLAELGDLGVAATLIVRTSREGIRTWVTGDDVGLTFAGDVVIATRGLGPDLVSADVTGTRQALGQGAPTGFYGKFHSYLDGENRTVFRSLQCRITGIAPESVEIIGRSHRTRRIDETCYLPGQEILNQFWKGQDGVMWKTRQWIGPDAGYMTTERLVR